MRAAAFSAFLSGAYYGAKTMQHERPSDTPPAEPGKPSDAPGGPPVTPDDGGSGEPPKPPHH